MARLALPVLGDACEVQVIGDDGTLRSIATLHAVPEREGRPLHPKSTLSVPIVTGGSTLGTFTFFITESNRTYGAADRALAEVLAGAAALAADSARRLTERQRAEAALVDSEARYRTVVEQSADGIAIAVGTTYVYANQAAASILGLADPTDLVGRSIDSFLDPEARERVLRHARARQRGEPAPTRYEVTLRREDGAPRTVELVAAPVLYRGETASLAIVRDVTERREAERHLLRLNERLRLLLDTSAALGGTLDPDALLAGLLERVVRVLPAADGGAIHLYDPVTDQFTLRASVGTDPAAGTPNSITVPLRTPDLRTIGTLSVGSTTTALGGEDLPLLEGVALQVAMALENARLYADARRSAGELAAALADLESAQLRLVEQERLRAMGEMASGIAHDLNNALAPVFGFAELLLEVPDSLEDPVKVRQYLELIHAGARDAATIVSRLREFYRHREHTDGDQPVDIAPLVEQVVALTQPRWQNQALASGRTIRVDTALEPVPAVAGHAAELREALTNLIFNAVDAMPRGGTITIACRLDETPGARVALSVRDTGTGMSEETRRRCLEPFYSTKGDAGTGLGLSMVFGTVRRHQGELTIESALNAGTTVTIWLPVYESGTADQTSVERVEPVRPLRVLVVDDEPTVRQVTEAYLHVDGHAVTGVGSGRDALEALHRAGPDAFDVVLTDRAMPDMSGDQLAETIKQIAPGMPVIMLTGFGAVMSASDSPNADAVLSKPVTLAELRAAIARVRGARDVET